MFAFILFFSLYVEDRVDYLEINTLYNEKGKFVLKQLIFWEFKDGCYRVVAWRKVGKYILTENYVSFRDVDVSRKVYFKFKRYTATNYDPEVLNRDIFPEEARRGLGVRP